MEYNLFLDDFRMPEDTFNYMPLPIYNIVDWHIVRSYQAFIDYIQYAGVPKIISFDHDLADSHYDQQSDIDYTGDGEKTGFHCAKWLINYCMDNKKELPVKILVHSMNPAGSRNIKSLFDTYFKVYEIDYEPIRMIRMFE